jgi:butyryl-CoA dehydrogenase
LLVDDTRTAADDAERRRLQTVLELLTPIAKSWPAEWCLEANNHAIQVLGGYGYTRDFPVEQYWRDNRLNMIHEGAHGIHGLDLLGRKVVMDGGAALTLLGERVAATIGRAAEREECAASAHALADAWQHLVQATRAAWTGAQPEEALANATPYLQAFGHVVLAWLWLDIALTARQIVDKAGPGAVPDPFLAGKLQAARYFFDYELPKIGAWLPLVAQRTDTCLRMQDEWFES